ncbi:Pimeloyl-ACP methyl ester carboxylesterase [Actinokineospora alba]|uniref:Pimeloyl-ACP methyl ester carboxylesterase n=1 Tax=Actinokineospora alba TaxID=504798 RepID=A0A1H0SUF9_9PSEU|nr:alpha/beta hydrolase [Actinokineospora alba]TDP66535.1 pimeloyl-ACP methyl ester carboxylesterase [Actinokineospora alba]SDJ37197.1 Pimeloyl-ACP methyl ester carboxylesterase [Actinokineospora alba]SDP45265.1 Pimeloyl-ACP methyl ester carboxylesterase [Actinokineospora alba]
MLINGVAVGVEVAGTGPPLVLLHGILQDSRSWRPQLADLRDEFTVVAWDAPGCGQSADPPSTWRLAEYADCLGAVIAALELDDPVLVGLSWGGALAIEFHHRHPGVASALVLASAYAGWAGSLPPEVCAERLASCLAQSELAPESFVPDWLPGLLTTDTFADEVTAMMSDFHPSGFRTMAHAMAEADLRPVLPTIDVPVLLLYGDDDKRAPADTVGAALAAPIRDSRMVVIPGTGHLCNLEQSERFNDAIRNLKTD